MRIKWNKLGLEYEKITVDGIFQREGVVDAVYFCPNCGNEIYGEWKYTRGYNTQGKSGSAIVHAVNESVSKYKAMQEEAATFASLNFCPVCGEHLIHEDGFFIQNDMTSDEQFFTNPVCRNSAKPGKAIWLNGLDAICDFMARRREKVDKQTANIMVQGIIAASDVQFPNQPINDDIKRIKDVPQELKDYLHQIVRLESSIISVSERLPVLYKKQIDLKRLVTGEKALSLYSAHAEVRMAEKKVHDLELVVQQLSERPVTIASIPKPVTPEKPVLQKANIFNRKRVEAENQQLQVQYQKAQEQYERQLQDWQELKKQKEQDSMRQRQTEVTTAKQAVLAAQLACSDLKTSLREKMESVHTIEVPGSDLLLEIDKEVEQAESLLKGLFEIRNKLYSYNIVYSKYRHFMAVATFCEYLLTGRCSSLEGPDGAYNLFESECRSQTIISQLSQVAGSIDQLKSTQFLIWEQLQKNNQQQEQLNSLMNIALPTLGTRIETIVNSNNVIAYNSAVAAYYSQINAEIASSARYIEMVSQ